LYFVKKGCFGCRGENRFEVFFLKRITLYSWSYKKGEVLATGKCRVEV
jgi:hypothetical protein